MGYPDISFSDGSTMLLFECYRAVHPTGGQIGIEAITFGVTIPDNRSRAAVATISNVFFTMKLLIEVGVTS